MATLRVPVALNSLHLPESAPRFEATPVSWFTVECGQDGEMRCGRDESELRFLHLPPDLEGVHFDLNWSHPRDEFDPSAYGKGWDMQQILTWIVSTNRDLDEVDFVVSDRCVLVKLLLLPYLNSDPYLTGLDFYLTKVGGTLFVRSGGRHACTSEPSDSTKKFQYLRSKQGLKFQQHLVTRSPGEYPDPSQPLVQWDNKLCVAMQVTFGRHKLLYKSQVKCLQQPHDLAHLSNANFTDLRTNSRNSADYIQWYKWLDFWANHVVARFNKVVVGYVSNHEEGVVRRLDVLEGEDMMRRCQLSMENFPRKFRQVPAAQACFDFLDRLLGFLQREMVDAGPDDVYRLRWEKCKLARLEKVAECPKDHVVPDWFKNRFSHKDKSTG